MLRVDFLDRGVDCSGRWSRDRERSVLVIRSPMAVRGPRRPLSAIVSRRIDWLIEARSRRCHPAILIFVGTQGFAGHPAARGTSAAWYLEETSNYRDPLSSSASTSGLVEGGWWDEREFRFKPQAISRKPRTCANVPLNFFLCRGYSSTDGQHRYRGIARLFPQQGGNPFSGLNLLASSSGRRRRAGETLC